MRSTRPVGAQTHRVNSRKHPTPPHGEVHSPTPVQVPGVDTRATPPCLSHALLLDTHTHTYHVHHSSAGCPQQPVNQSLCPPQPLPRHCCPARRGACMHAPSVGVNKGSTANCWATQPHGPLPRGNTLRVPRAAPGMPPSGSTPPSSSPQEHPWGHTWCPC